MLDCGIVTGFGTRGTDVSALVCNGMPLIQTVPGQYRLRYEVDVFPTRSNVII